MNTRAKRVPPVVWLSAAAASLACVKAGKSGKLQKLLGWGLTVGGVGLGLWALRDFKHSGTTINPMVPEDASVLVTEGAHSISRHPMYVAMVSGLLGQAIVKGRTKALLPVLALWAALSLQATDEENALAERFGRSYLGYHDRVPRWL